MFRVTKKQFYDILDLIKETIYSAAPKAIHVRDKLALLLHFLGHTITALNLSNTVGISRTCVLKHLDETSSAIVDKMEKIYVKTPTNTNQWRKISDRFFEKYGFCHTMGCLGILCSQLYLFVILILDGKHIRLQSPPNGGSKFFNYKHYHSVVLMALVDADGRVRIFVSLYLNGWYIFRLFTLTSAKLVAPTTLSCFLLPISRSRS